MLIPFLRLFSKIRQRGFLVMFSCARLSNIKRVNKKAK